MKRTLHILSLKEVESLVRKGILSEYRNTGWLRFDKDTLEKILNTKILMIGFYDTHIDFFKRHQKAVVYFNTDNLLGGPFYGTNEFNFYYPDTRECWENYLRTGNFKKIEI